MNDMKKMQKARAEALEAALGALSAGVGRDTAWTAEPEEVLQYAKFILGKKKRRRTKVQGGERRAYVAKQGTPLPRTEEELKGWTPLGYMTGDDLKEDPSFSVADLFASSPVPGIPGPPTIAAATLEKFAEKVRDGNLAADLEPASTFSPVGEDPGDQGVLTQWAEAIRQQDAAREAAREAQDLEVDPEEEEEKKPEVLKGVFPTMPTTHEEADAAQLNEGSAAGCPECEAELERRAKRDEALEEGRRKLAERLDATAGRLGPLDEDELLAVAGSEVYPPNDEEPSRELKIRNRKGEVRSYASGASNSPGGWTVYPDNPWMRREDWTSLEMSRRGPWHVV